MSLDIERPALLRERAWALWQAGLAPLYLTRNDTGKWTPQVGTTGRVPFPAEFPEPPVTAGSARLENAVRLALRVPPGAILIDVDNHTALPDEAAGPGTLDQLEADLGHLAPTFKLTARGASRRVGKYGFRIPEGLELHEGAFKDRGGHIDLIQTHHRFAFAPGHVKAEGEPPAAIWTPDGQELDALPHVSTWPELPQAWVEALSSYTFGARGSLENPEVRHITVDQARAETADAWTDYWSRPGNAGQGARDALLRAAWCQGKLDRLVYGEPSPEIHLEAMVAAHPDFGGEAPEENSTAWKAALAGYAYADLSRWEESRGEAMFEAVLGGADPVWPTRAFTPDGLEEPAELVNVTSVARTFSWLQQTLGTGALSGLFLRGGEIVHVPRINGNGYLPVRRMLTDESDFQVHPLSRDGLAAIVQRRYTLVKTVTKKDQGALDQPAVLPAEALRVLGAPSECSGLRTLASVVGAPVFRPNGTLIDQLGYDDATGTLFISDDPPPPTPPNPTPAEIAEAAARIAGLIADFPFETPHDRANLLGALFTPALVRMLPPPWKLVEISAPQPGSGKSLLASVLIALYAGVKRPSFPEEEELRKSISSILQVTTGSVVVFDNVSGSLRSPTLEMLTTSDHWSDRKLGSNTDISKANDRLWVVTANNLVLAGDMHRRVLRVRINTHRPDPENRDGFRIEHLETYVKDNRGVILRDLYTVVIGWVQAGRPGDRAAGGDGYSRWRGGLRSLLDWSGLAVDARGEVGVFDSSGVRPVREDGETDGWPEFLRAVREEFGDHTWTVGEVLDNRSIYVSALPVPVAEKSTLPAQKSTLGKMLMQRRETWYDGLSVVVATTDKHRKLKVWRIIEDPLTPHDGTSGPESDPGGDPRGVAGDSGGSSLPPMGVTRPHTGQNSSPKEEDGPPATARTPRNSESWNFEADPSTPRFAPPARVTRAAQQLEQLTPEDCATQLGQWLGGPIVVDVETSGYPIGHPLYALRSIQLGDSNTAVRLDSADDDQTGLARIVLDAASEIAAHSPSADLVPLEHAGIIDGTAWERVTDTAVVAALAPPRYRPVTRSDGEGALGLKELAKHNLKADAVAPAADKARAARFRAGVEGVKGQWLTNTDPLTPPERSGWLQVPIDDPAMTVYACSDVLDTAALKAKLPPLEPGLADRERTVLAMTARVTRHGLALDPDWTRAKLTEAETRLALVTQTLAGHGFTDPSSPAKSGARLTELGARLPLTAKGAPSTDKDALYALLAEAGPTAPIAQALLEWRAEAKVLSTYLRPWMLQVEHGDGRLRPTVYTLGAVATGRMSCVEATALVEMPRDLVKYPDGVPITEVKEGDYVYAFNWRRELTLRRVKWVAQTGVRETVKLTVRNSDGHELTLRLTPEHLVRLYNGDWRAAGHLDHRYGRARREDAQRVMTMVRRRIDDGYVKLFPHAVAKNNGVFGGGKVREHRWVIEQITGKRISTKTDVHHEDGNRANNTPSNLKPLTVAEHRGRVGDVHPWWGGNQHQAPDLYIGSNDYRVVSVEPGQLEPVWDMEVEGDHNFIANGICVHNCARPNLQQVAREGGMRGCIVADPGRVFVSADFSSVEVRVAAALSQDTTLMAMLADGTDLHATVAEIVWGPGWTKAQRYIAKRAVFGRLYGSGIAGIARNLGISEDLARQIVDALDAVTPGLSAWSKNLSRFVENTAQPTWDLPSGRVIWFDKDRPYAAGNYAIQGTARELLVDALLRWQQTPWGGAVLMPIHDELLVMVPEGEAVEAGAMLEACMTFDLYGVAIEAEASTPSYRWADSA